ncbi:hypothetical protein COU37_02150 [Candidatus Micrarchaeota archaeon CG10_big_fil_rev_8_21_14_0_10_45_29]|nr:MAG: hypothetical protein COU37_02150 [Candidatus Micrarchaeota archaeon CG10_big_fil_rev_8_21_14_0_10_45_29]
MANKYSVVLKEDKEDGGYVAIVPELPGCISDGDTKEEALKNIRDAIRLYLESIANETRKFHALAKKGRGIDIASVSA